MNAIHDPRVRPIVEYSIPHPVPKKIPPTKPVASPGTGAATTCSAWSPMKIRAAFARPRLPDAL